YAVDGVQTYAIDAKASGIAVTAVPSPMKSATVSVASLVTGDVTTYTFTAVTTNEVPADGYLIVRFPAEVSIPDTGAAAGTCVAVAGFTAANFACDVTATSVKVLNGFEGAPFAADGTLTFSIGGIKNPPSTRATQSFGVSTYTSAGSDIDSTSTGVLFACTTANTLAGVAVTPSSLVNGGTADYTFSVTVTNATPTGCRV
ncbi:MAG: hypothetical protein V2I33_24050, partial [Kangiellaceae bacterium]|nr:hypothetical protein [Kangiellaceae bacterium]